MSLSLTASDVRGVVVVDLSGRFTVLEVDFRETILQFLRSGKREFVFKMNDLSYIDSFGLGQLISVYTSILNAGGSVRLHTPGQRVRDLLKITKLDTVFDIIEDENPDLKTSVASTSS